MTSDDYKTLQNKIFIRLLPRKWREDDVRDAFGVFGNITSVYMDKRQFNLEVYISYGSSSEFDQYHGFLSVEKAMKSMHNYKIDGTEILIVTVEQNMID